jgi:hypothetical protein
LKAVRASRRNQRSKATVSPARATLLAERVGAKAFGAAQSGLAPHRCLLLDRHQGLEEDADTAFPDETDSRFMDVLCQTRNPQ